MDLSTVFFTAWAPLLWWAIPLLLASALLNSAWFKGKLGEWAVRREIARHLAPPDYTVLHDVTLPINGSTTQIDHIVLSRFGLFVVETKHYAGWVFGNERNLTWTQVLHGQKFSFQNPLRQNLKHIHAISAALENPATEIQSVIIFTGSARFKTAMPEHVADLAGGIAYIRRWRTTRYTQDAVDTFVDTLLQRRLAPGIKTNRTHLSNLNKAAKDPRCPTCGTALVLRTARKGSRAGSQFWGCAGFPKCRYTRPC